jgi:hypothetical protein
LKTNPGLVALPDVPEPTSHGVIGEYRISSIKISKSILRKLNREIPDDIEIELTPLKEDVPDANFTGPF